MSYTVPYTQGLLVFNSNPFYIGYNNVSDVKNNNALVRQLGNVDTVVSNVTATQIHGNALQLFGYYRQDDNGGSTIVWNATSTAVDDNATVFKPVNITGSGRWIRQFSNNSANVHMWGAVGDGVTDDQPAIQAAINYCSLSGINNLYFNSANYRLALSGLQLNSSLMVSAMTANKSLWPNNFVPPYPAAGYVSGYLNIGFNPGTNRYYNLNLIGTGSTKLFSNEHNTRGYRGLIFLSSNLTACNISGFTFEQQALSAGNGMYANGGIIMGGYSPVQIDGGYFTPSKVNTITIANNQFINCHSAIKGGTYSVLSGTSLPNLNIINNTFRYPRGSDVINYTNPDGSGGTIVTLDNTTIQNLNVINNVAEGTSQPNNGLGWGKSKDGFMFGSAVNSLIQNNIVTNFGVESMYSNILGFGGPGIYNNITVPAVGQQLTVNFNSAASNWTPYTFASYLCAFFVPSKYYDLLGSGYGGTNTSLGIYQLQQLLVPTLSNIGTSQYNFSAIFVSVSGILGNDPWYNQYTYYNGGTPGLTAYAANFAEYNPTGTYGITVSGIGNTIIGGGYPWRSDMGAVLLSGNNFLVSTSGFGGFNLFPFEHADPKGYQILTNNNYYMYNELPKSTNYVPTCISISTSGSQIYNDNFYLWVDSTNTSTTAVNNYTPQIYNNCGDNLVPYIPANGYNPTYYNPIAMSYGTTNQHMMCYNNNFFISNPLSAQLLGLMGSDTTNTIYGNNVYFNNVNSVTDLRNVYSTTFNANVITYGGGRFVTLSSQNIQINTYYGNTPGDNLGGTFAWVASSLTTDNGSNIIKPNALTSGQPGRWTKQ